MITIISLLIGLACAYRCGEMANDRNRRVWLWCVVGFSGGLLAVLAVHLLKPVAGPRTAGVIDDADRSPSQEAQLDPVA